MKEFYSNLKKGINDVKSLMHELIFVRGDKFEFSPVLISSIFNTKVVRRKRTKKLDLGLDMNDVAIELIGKSVLV